MKQKSRLKKSDKAKETKNLKPDVYRPKYQPKSRKFSLGEIVSLIRLPKSRGWISKHAKLGMAGIVVDYGPGVYDYAVYWSEVDYKGEPVTEFGNRWQMFYVKQNDIKLI